MAKAKDEMQDSGDEKLKRPLFVITFIVIALILVMIFVYLMSGSVPMPPENSREDQQSWMDELPNTIWLIDDSTKKEELEELSYHTVKSLWFSEKDTGMEYLTCYMETPEMVMVAKVFKGAETLIMSIDGFELELWSAQNREGGFRTLTLKGKESWLFFTLDE